MSFNLYSDVITQHSKNPLNYIGGRGVQDSSYYTVVGKFPACSENLLMYLKPEGEKFIDIRWTGSGSSIMIASASISTEILKGKTFAEALTWADAVFEAFSKIRPFKQEEIGDIIGLESVKNYPRRVRSAILPAHTIKLAIAKLRIKNERQTKAI